MTPLRRENGLVEIVCEHGVGHPSAILTSPRLYYGVHGCDGCCSRPEWKAKEDELAIQTEAIIPGL